MVDIKAQWLIEATHLQVILCFSISIKAFRLDRYHHASLLGYKLVLGCTQWPIFFYQHLSVHIPLEPQIPVLGIHSTHPLPCAYNTNPELLSITTSLVILKYRKQP